MKENMDSFKGSDSPTVKCWLATNGVVLVHVLIGQAILLLSHWSFLLFMLDSLFFLVPTFFNIAFLFGPSSARDFIVKPSVKWLVDAYLIITILATIALITYAGFGLTALQFTEFTGILQLVAYALAISLTLI